MAFKAMKPMKLVKKTVGKNHKSSQKAIKDGKRPQTFTKAYEKPVKAGNKL